MFVVRVRYTGTIWTSVSEEKNANNKLLFCFSIQAVTCAFYSICPDETRLTVLWENNRLYSSRGFIFRSIRIEDADPVISTQVRQKKQPRRATVVTVIDLAGLRRESTLISSSRQLSPERDIGSDVPTAFVGTDDNVAWAHYRWVDDKGEV